MSVVHTSSFTQVLSKVLAKLTGDRTVFFFLILEGFCIFMFVKFSHCIQLRTMSAVRLFVHVSKIVDIFVGSDQCLIDHCLVDFEEEDCVGVVPKSSVLNNKDLTVGVKRTVKCNGGKYKAIILAIGSKSEMQQKEEEITESDEEEELNLDEETSSGPGSVKRKQCQSGKSKQSKKLKEGKAKTKKGKENEKLIKNDGAKKKQRKLKDKNSSFSMELGSPPRDSKAAHDSTSPLWEKDFHEEIYEQYSQARTPKGIDSIRRKRKRYRRKKKDLKRIVCTSNQAVDEMQARNERSDLYGEFIDSEALLPPPDESEIHLPHYINLMDEIHLKARMIELQSQQEKAKGIARHYRDQCSQLKTKLVEKEAEIVQIKVDAAHAKNRIRQFWRNCVIEGQSRSGRILRSGLNMNNRRVL
ncbi:uncharacterized protein [Dysidea avara]|uniref:uncharacterized protein isoform X4 n=1 Tax=Dysidea avara TaxID=196820 RepID=UPI0033169EAA